MADGDRPLTISAVTRGAVSDIPAQVWDNLANPPDRPHNPFVSSAFLGALERSGSVGGDTGWTPSHVLIEEGGVPIAAAPLYIKTHSFGEYVFDHDWADAFERAGGRYYPKLLCASPFTPVPGPRLLARDESGRRMLAASLEELAARIGAPSAHVNFIGEDDATSLAAAGWLARIGVQFHWLNEDYQSFDDFLRSRASRKRKAIARERREAVDGLSIRRLIGAEISGEVWDAFWSFYQETGSRKWGRPYLTRAFFDEIAETMTGRILMIAAYDGARPVAGALNFIGDDALFGRYWGRTSAIPFLHFEICYYQAIEFAIERRLARVEAGAQGEHKLARGYRPVATRSAHFIANPGFRGALARHLSRERTLVLQEIEAISALTPFRRDGNCD